MEYGFGLNWDISELAFPKYIAIEGPIGVGKTTLARHLAQSLNYTTVLEQVQDNPFLERFYANPRASALPTQLFFLFQRTKQLQNLRQSDLFQSCHIADFLMEKDQLFAQVTLDNDELRLYQQVYDQLSIEAPTPDLVIVLQAPTEVLLSRIHSRGMAAERSINGDYLSKLNDTYTRFFHFYDKAPLLMVNVSDIDLANNQEHYRQLVEYLFTVKNGRHYYNPNPLF